MSWRGADARAVIFSDFALCARENGGLGVCVVAADSVVRNRMALAGKGRETVAEARRVGADVAVRSGIWRNMSIWFLSASDLEVQAVVGDARRSDVLPAP